MIFIKAFHHGSNIKCPTAEIHQFLKLWLLHVIFKWKYMHYFACSLQIPLCTTEWNVAHTWIMRMMRLELRTFWFLEGKESVLSRFLFRNEKWNLSYANLNGMKFLSFVELSLLRWLKNRVILTFLKPTFAINVYHHLN